MKLWWKLDDSPWNYQMETKFLGFCRKSASRIWSSAARDRWGHSQVTVLFARLAKGQYGRSDFEQLHSDEKIWRSCTKLAPLYSSGPLHWLSPLFWVLDLLRVSNSPELKSFSLACAQKAPESITKCRSSGFVEKGARITQDSAGVDRISWTPF